MKPRDLADKSTADLPERLKAARKNANLTQDDLVEIAEFSPVALSKFERGINSPSFTNFVAMCHALKVSPNFLTGWEEVMGEIEGAEKRLLLNRLVLVSEGLSEEWIEQLISLAEHIHKDQEED